MLRFIISCDESWVSGYYPQIKKLVLVKASAVSKPEGGASGKKLNQERGHRFSDIHRVVHRECVPQGQTVNESFTVTSEVEHSAETNWSILGVVTHWHKVHWKGVFFGLSNKVFADHLHYFTLLAPCDSVLILKIKVKLKRASANAVEDIQMHRYKWLKLLLHRQQSTAKFKWTMIPVFLFCV